MAAAPPSQGKKVHGGVDILPPPPLELDEGEDPTEDIVDAIVAEGARVLYEQYLNASVLPYTCSWVTRSLDELLAVVTTKTRCDFVLPTWEPVPSVIPLDNLARAMVPVAPTHQSKYTMVLSSLESEASSTDVDECIEAPPWKDLGGNVADEDVCIASPSPQVGSPGPVLASVPSADMTRYIQRIQEPPETNAEARRLEDERRRKLLKVLEEATISQQQQDLLAQQRAPLSRPVTCPSTSPRKRRAMQNNHKQTSATEASPRNVAAPPTTPTVSVDFAVFDVQYIDGCVHKRPASTGSKKAPPSPAPPSRRHKDRSTPVHATSFPPARAIPSPNVDYQPSSYGNVLQDLVLMPGVKMSSSPTKPPWPGLSPPSSRQDGSKCATHASAKDGADATRAATATRLDIKEPTKPVERTASLFAKAPSPSTSPPLDQEERRHRAGNDAALRSPLSPPKQDTLRQTSRPRTSPSPLAASRRPIKPS